MDKDQAAIIDVSINHLRDIRPNQSLQALTDPNMEVTNESVKSLDRENVFHSWSVQSANDPVVIKSGSGSKLWDYDGKEYLDFTSQLIYTNLGHQHPKIIEAMKCQIDTLVTIAPSHANIARAQAASRILAHVPDRKFSKVFFTNAGADANENAMRMARTFTGRDKILSGYRSYHGNSGASIVATGDPRRIPNEFSRGHVHFFNPFLYRSEFYSESQEEECSRALHHLRRVIQCEGPHSIAAIILESIPGTAGVLVPPKNYLKGVRALADEFGFLLILDEVMVGFGRTGKWFGFEHFDVVPDLITFAKGVNSGYVPAGGVILSNKVSDFFENRMFYGGLTYSGHPLAMAAIVATIDAMSEEKTVENAEAIGREVLSPGLMSLYNACELIGEVRGMGVFYALEMVNNRKDRTPLDAQTMKKFKKGMIERGLLPFIAENRLHVAPPCNITPEQAKEGIRIIGEALKDICSCNF